MKALIVLMMFGMIRPAETLQETPAIEISEGEIDSEEVVHPDRIAWNKILQWPEACNDGANTRFTSYSGITEYKVNKNESVVLVACELYAYQEGYRLYHYNSNTQEATELKMTRFDEDDNEVVSEDGFGGLADLDENGNLMIFTKFAGHAQCGSVLDYQWNDANKKMELISQISNFDCDKLIMSDEWPVIYEINE